MKKHAYLLIVHEYTFVLETLLKCIDAENNDIFIHIDRKAKYFPIELCKENIKKSKFIIVPGIEVHWGGYSQIQSELILLKNALKQGKYQYYHLLSGSDLPLRPQVEIHRFFDDNNGKEFVRFESDHFGHADRVKYYFLSEKFNEKRKNNPHGMEEMIVKASIRAQHLLGVSRNHSVKFQKGTNWFSITDEFAHYVVSKEEWIRSVFHHTFCADEIFLQTLLLNSDFKDNLYYPVFDNNPQAIMRYIDWERGNPYTFRKDDFDDLIQSGMMFARKFSEKTDRDIIQMIYEYVLQKTVTKINPSF